MESKLQELKVKQELSKPVTVVILNIRQLSCSFKADYRRDLYDFLYSISWKRDHVTQIENIPLKEFYKLQEWCSTEPNVTFNCSQQLLDRVHYYLEGPDVYIDLRKDKFGNIRDLTVKIKPELSLHASLGDSAAIALWDSHLGLYKIPIIEAANLYKNAMNSVEWSAEARDFAIKQLETKSTLADIAKLEYAEEGNVPIGARELRPFQTVGVAYMHAINFRGIIGDEMGLGKTLQGIASIIKADAKRVAVIVPATLRENWRREILSCTGERAMMHGGTVPSQLDFGAILKSETKWHIFNYDMFSRPLKVNEISNGVVSQRESYPWVDAINLLLFDAVILDEAHRIKNIKASRTKAILHLKVPKIICLTGTPIINRPAELWPALHLVAPEKFNDYDGYITRYTDGKNGARNTDELKELIAPFFIRRKKLDVIKDLPPIERTTRFIELSDADISHYRKLMAKIRIDLSSGDETGVINSILEKILRVKQFLSDRKAIEVAEFAMDTYDQTEEGDPYRKIIIFSQFIPCVDKIANHLGESALTIVGDRHSPLERQHIVDRFQREDKYKYLVCSIFAANEGLNITAAGHVMFADFMWNDAAHQQAEGRAYGRISDAHSIESHYFAVPNTLDDWLQGILLEKMQTVEAVLEGVDDARNKESSILKNLFAVIRGGQL